MRKNFNSVQMFETSENCRKFSKSVSYETLVGGTATTGREYKQTRRLFLSSADKPLSAVGTLTSLLCNSAKVMENILQTSRDLRSDNKSEKSGQVDVCADYRFCKTMRFSYENLVDGLLQMSPVFRLIKIFGLVTVLSVGMVGESWADDVTPVCTNSHGTEEVTCIDKLTDANGNNSCGDNCTYKVIVENGQQVLHIYKTDISKSASIRQGAFSPTYYAGRRVLDADKKDLPLNNIVFDNDFENIGREAFARSGAQITNASGKFTFNDVNVYAFFGGVTMNGDVVFNKNSGGGIFEISQVNGDVVFSDNVTAINWYTIGNTVVNGDVIIPESVKNIQGKGISVSYISGKIYCASGIESCYDMAKAGCNNEETCLSLLDNLLNSKKFSAYPDGCEKLEANLKCTKCKNSSFKLENDGWCLRKIYTPAEAAEVLKDDNTNEITITFKK